jgi:quinol monooxygenase YgiN
MARSSLTHRPPGAGYVVIAEFDVSPAHLNEFLALANSFSDECIESESGCWQFDVVTLEATASGVLFYEAYDNAEAFEAHCRSTHLVRFKAAFETLGIREKPLRRGSRGNGATPTV